MGKWTEVQYWTKLRQPISGNDGECEKNKASFTTGTHRQITKKIKIKKQPDSTSLDLDTSERGTSVN